MRPASDAGSWRRAMVARSPDEEHRNATVLELFFDLCFLVAVAQASAGLHQAVSDGHLSDGVLGYVLVFFAIWWAWMNFTWFASAYDPDDLAYRLTTLVQIAGALILAAGVPRAMDRRDFGVTTVGYVVMRLAMVTQWLRAAHSDPPRRRCCLRYAAGITLLQLGWVGLLAGAHQRWALAAFALLAVGELAVPVWAERAAPTTWHPHHIAERYGLFTMIVLGESVLAATLAVQSALDAEVAAVHTRLATIASGGLLTVFAMWWLYFATDAGRLLGSLRAAITWGYGHYLIFASAAAVGAGLAVTVDAAVGHARIGERAAGAAFTVPVALFVLTVWALQLRPTRRAAGTARWLPLPRSPCSRPPSPPSRCCSPAWLWPPWSPLAWQILVPNRPVGRGRATRGDGHLLLRRVLSQEVGRTDVQASPASGSLAGRPVALSSSGEVL